VLGEHHSDIQSSSSELVNKLSSTTCEAHVSPPLPGRPYKHAPSPPPPPKQHYTSIRHTTAGTHRRALTNMELFIVYGFPAPGNFLKKEVPVLVVSCLMCNMMLAYMFAVHICQHTLLMMPSVKPGSLSFIK